MEMAQRRISYADRDFESLRQDLINYTQQYYPELIDNFNDAAVFVTGCRGVIVAFAAGIAVLRLPQWKGFGTALPTDVEQYQLGLDVFTHQQLQQ